MDFLPTRRRISCSVSLAMLLGLVLVAPACATSKAKGKDVQMQAVQRELDQLIDREAIRELPITYCHYVHQKDVKAIVDLFTADGRLQLSQELGSGAEGMEALRTFYEKSIASADPWPFVHNHHIEILGPDRAKGSIYAEIRYGSQGYRTVAIGVYEDEYQKVGGVWKFKSRVFKSHTVAN